MELVVIIPMVVLLGLVMAFGAVHTWHINQSIDRDLEALNCLTNGHRTYRTKNGLRSCKCGVTL